MDWALAWKVVTALGVTGIVSAWLGAYLGGFLPPPPRLVRAVRETSRRLRGRRVAVADAERYHLVLCGLDGDDVKEGTLRLLQGALNPLDYPMLHITLASSCISLARWHERKDMSAGAAQADRVLRDYAADAVLWGEVPKQGDSLRLFVRGADRQETQIMQFDKGLAKERPVRALGPVLAAVALSQIAPATEEGGRYLVARLTPVIARLKALLADPRLVPTTDRGNLHYALGLALMVIGGQSGDPDALNSAVATFHDALRERTREREPLAWAMTQDRLGTAHYFLGTWEFGRLHLERAVAAYCAALEERKSEEWPLEWAQTQNNLANALQALGEQEASNGQASGTARLVKAVAAFRSALGVWRRDREPLHWAQTQNNLGNALRSLGVALQGQGETARGTAYLEEAVLAHQAALKERTRDREPLKWATTKSNLANVLAALGRLEEAVVTYREALKECRRDRIPLVWAETQHNLGSRLFALGMAHHDERATAFLEQAVAAYELALEERTRYPGRRKLVAASRFGLARANAVLAVHQKSAYRMELALTDMREAAEMYLQAGDSRSVFMAQALITGMEFDLAKLRR